ncbi:hypothetical protein ACJ6WF_47715 [Streptomyces sp. MMS24-I2-30]|uniref:hypothetical protein n=1 Tax=Streptomyces sp. MMS24-I2-30 TaxID=3351564 RepID=UPI003896AB5A
MDQLAGSGDRSAAGIRALYFPQDGSLPLVPRGVLPTQSRKGAPEGEARARRRMHTLLKPEYRASAAEERVLREAGIPLLPRKNGGFCIDRGVERVSDQAAAVARFDSAVAIAELYGLTEGSSALVPHGVLPTQSRKGAPEGEARARRRMHDLLKPDCKASAAEVEVLRDAGIPLLRRQDGSFCIAPGVERVSDEAAAVARFDSAVAIAELYGLTEGSSALVPRGVLPTWSRKGAPEGEARARQRMHDLLKPDRRASAAEEKVLRDAQIPLLPREDGGFYIDPGVERESGVKMRVGSSAVPVLLSGQWRPVAASVSPLPVAAVPAWPEQLAAGPTGPTGATGAVGAVGDPPATGGREGSHGGGPGLWQAGRGLPPGTGMPWTQDGIPLGQGDDVLPAQPVQPGFPEGRPGFAEVLSGGSGGGLVPGGFGGGSVDALSGVSGVSGFWSAPVNPAVPYTGGYLPGAAWDVHPPGTDTLTQTQATQEPATQELAAGELGAWGLGVAAPVYSRAGEGVGSLPGDPVTASGRAGYVPAVADDEADASVSGRPAMPAAGAYLPQGLPSTRGTRARRDDELPVQGMQADRLKRPRRG